MAVVSSCRKVLGSVPQRAQPSCLVAIVEFGTLNRLPVLSRRKVRMTSSHHAPYALGDSRATMGRDKGSRSCEGELTPKTRPQFGLQAATRLHEAGIASNRRSAIRR